MFEMLFSWRKKKKPQRLKQEVVLEREKLTGVHVLANELIVREELARNIKVL